MLRVENVQKRLGTRAILQGVNLHCEDRDVVVITGPNGSGKSTLLRVLAGVIRADRGEVELQGHSLARAPARAKACLGYAPDGLEPLPDLLVSEFLALVRALKPAPDGSPGSLDPNASARLAVDTLVDQRLASLSFGQRKRVTLLAALIGGPWLLLLDEPTNGLDPTGVERIHELLTERRAAGLVTILSTNDAEFAAAVAGRRYRLEQGGLSPA